MIVFDASTLILLAKVDLLGLFISHAKVPVLVPEAVRAEACGSGREETPVIARLLETGAIKTEKPRSRGMVRKLMVDFTIDLGETEAIAIAFQEKGAVVATDDRNAIRACKMLGIKFVTAISVLVTLYEKQLIARDASLAKLEKLAAIGRYGKAIIANAAKRLSEEY